MSLLNREIIPLIHGSFDLMPYRRRKNTLSNVQNMNHFALQQKRKNGRGMKMDVLLRLAPCQTPVARESNEIPRFRCEINNPREMASIKDSYVCATVHTYRPALR
jgi:hypothetical protein